MTFYNLNKEEKNKIADDFMYVYSPICKVFNEFIPEADYIRNSFNDEINDWDYISIVTKKKYSSGTTAVATCSFKSYGAPIIVFTDDICIGKNGKRTYGHHYEVVAYEDGINIWSIVPYPERLERPVLPTKIAFLKFPVKADTEIKLEVTIENKMIVVKMCNHILKVSDSNIPEKFHIGITACEGENKFYEFSLSNKEKNNL